MLTLLLGWGLGDLCLGLRGLGVWASLGPSLSITLDFLSSDLDTWGEGMSGGGEYFLSVLSS